MRCILEASPQVLRYRSARDGWLMWGDLRREQSFGLQQLGDRRRRLGRVGNRRQQSVELSGIAGRD